MYHSFFTNPTLMTFLMIAILWEATWKIIAMWKAARNNHFAWFICIALINTVGILPIVYILMHRGVKSNE